MVEIVPEILTGTEHIHLIIYGNHLFPLSCFYLFPYIQQAYETMWDVLPGQKTNTTVNYNIYKLRLCPVFSVKWLKSLQMKEHRVWDNTLLSSRKTIRTATKCQIIHLFLIWLSHFLPTFFFLRDAKMYSSFITFPVSSSFTQGLQKVIPSTAMCSSLYWVLWNEMAWRASPKAGRAEAAQTLLTAQPCQQYSYFKLLHTAQLYNEILISFY